MREKRVNLILQSYANFGMLFSLIISITRVILAVKHKRVWHGSTVFNTCSRDDSPVRVSSKEQGSEAVGHSYNWFCPKI